MSEGNIETNGVGKVSGAADAYFVTAAPGQPRYGPNQPLAWNHVVVQKLGEDQSFNLTTWQPVPGQKAYTISATGTGTLANDRGADLDVYNELT